ncbi:MAG: DUF695 domain-containing protein [Marinobacter sp.]|uniref:DUF695 domain-containing protein n=1 Tax=Marinobacter sp. TaxID=50741 RepID=UPI00299EA7CF|nr:DUF695 domain-containing protein [Marinobacter sp.]MDX1633898.1 DUF695 domain-containing protein [Marinobacter sp.]
MISPQRDLADPGLTGRAYEDGLPVFYRLEQPLPGPYERLCLPWLVVISWPYDGSGNEGMPSAEDNLRMFELEDLIEEEVATPNALRHVYSRTGNHLKELVYYLRNRDEFLFRFNQVMSGRSRFPIDLHFFEDEDWQDFRELLAAFEQSH